MHNLGRATVHLIWFGVRCSRFSHQDVVQVLIKIEHSHEKSLSTKHGWVWGVGSLRS
jgi:hypothetical protein